MMRDIFPKTVMECAEALLKKERCGKEGARCLPFSLTMRNRVLYDECIKVFRKTP